MKRHWASALRLLPGGETDPAAGLGVAVMFYGVFMVFGLVAGFVVSYQFQYDMAWVSSVSIANAIPAAALGAWVLYRLRSTSPLEVEQVAVDVARQRIYRGAQVGRMPLGAVVLPVRPRQALVELADGSRLKVFYRVTRDPDDLVRLARLLQAKGQTLEEWMREYFDLVVPRLLPDPEAIRDGLARELLDHGVLLTRSEGV